VAVPVSPLLAKAFLLAVLLENIPAHTALCSIPASQSATVRAIPGSELSSQLLKTIDAKGTPIAELLERQLIESLSGSSSRGR